MSELAIGKADRKAFTLPLDAVTQKVAFLGRTGSGKSYAGMKLAEEMHGAGAQIVALDVVGVWWGLRLAADGVSPGLDIPVLGGLRGDVPLAPTAGAMVADLIADRKLSVVLDMSQFETDKAKARFASDFADRFFRRQKAAPSPVHVFLEECQEFIPQNIQKGEEMMLHHWTRVAKLGRNFGIGMSLISQRPQEVNKKALNMTECLFALQMTGTHERKAIRDWLGAKGSEIDITNVLRGLPVGTAHVSSPQWLRFEDLVEVGRRWTFDSSSTPSFEDVERVQPGDLAPLDLDELQAAMAETITQAEANDPKALKKRIAELERELRVTKAESGLTPEEAEAIAVERAAAALHALRSEVRPHVEALHHALANGDGPADVDLARPQPKADTPARATRPTRPAPPPPTARATPKRSSSTPSDLSGPQQRILDALASLETLGLDRVQKSIVAVFADASPRSSAFSNNLGHLRSQLGLIEYPAGGWISLTDLGREVADPPDTPHSLADLHEAWSSKLSGPQALILDQVVRIYPDSIDKTALADLVGASATSSAYGNNLGRMRSLGIIDYPAPRQVAATELLFPPGLY